MKLDMTLGDVLIGAPRARSTGGPAELSNEDFEIGIVCDKDPIALSDAYWQVRWAYLEPDEGHVLKLWPRQVSQRKLLRTRLERATKIIGNVDIYRDGMVSECPPLDGVDVTELPVVLDGPDLRVSFTMEHVRELVITCRRQKWQNRHLMV